jgi:hypothetical protein
MGMIQEPATHPGERDAAPAVERSPQVATEGNLPAFLGRFARAEARDVVRARINAAIEQSVAPLPWPLRIAARSGLRLVAELPDWVAFERSAELLSVTFSGGVSLRAELGGAARLHQLPAGVRGNVRHFWNAGRLCTEVVSDHGTISNEYEHVSDDELLGHALLVSQYFPLPLRYSLRLRRT